MSRQVCIKCHSIPPNILILECDHGLCVACAATICSVISQNIICPLCDHPTYLSSQILSQLQSQYAQFQLNSSRNSIQKKSNYSQTIQSLKNSHQLQKSNISKSVKQKQISNLEMSRKNSMQMKNKNSKQAFDKQTFKKSKKQAKQQTQYECNIQISCKQHHQFQIMYICIECDNILICPQCIIHGIHKNHQVETLKKTLKKIQAELSSKVYALDCSIQGLILASDEEKSKLKSKFQQINELKNLAIQKYNRIKEQLDKEQEQILTYCKNLMDNYQRDFLSIQNWIQKDLKTIQYEKNLIYQVLNPWSNNQLKISKENKKNIQVNIINQYFNNYLRNNESNEIKQRNKHLWNYKQNTKISLIHANQQQNIEQLTDRIARICSPPNLSALSQLPNICNVETKSPSLAASRCKQGKNSNYWSKQSFQSTSPINRLSRYKNKENINVKRIENIARLI